MAAWGILTEAIKPLSELVDSVHTSESEKLELKAKMLEIQNNLTVQMLNYEKKLVESKAKIITQEAQGASWLQRNWRPICMLTFLILVVLDTMGMTAFRLSVEAWELLKIGLGGYVIGRSAEKIAPGVIEAIKSNK